MESKLKELKIEDFVWIVYLGIIILSWYSNSLERKYYIYGDDNYKSNYRCIVVLIFLILTLAYMYFFKSSYDSFKALSPNDSEKKKTLVTLSLIASLLILVSGVIFLLIAFADDDLDVELAFN